MKRPVPFVFVSLLFFLIHSQGSAASGVAKYEGLLKAIREVRAASEARIERAVEQEKVREAWETGKLIDEHVLLNKDRAKYGDRVIIRLAKDLGTSETELKYLLQFARTYPIRPAPDELSWAHYRELLSVNESKAREEIAKEVVKQKWSQKELRRQIKERRLIVDEKEAEPLPAITPGPLNTYQIIRIKDALKIDLGFGTYFDLPEGDEKRFKEGDIVEIASSLPTEGTVKGFLISPDAGFGKGVRASTPSKPRNDGHLVIASDPKGLLHGAKQFQLFTYSAQVTSVVDGDTFHALINLGFGITQAQRVRLRRIDAPEILTAEGKEAKAYLEKILKRDGGRIILQSHDLDQHGRPIADVWVKGKAVDQELLDQGQAVKIEG